MPFEGSPSTLAKGGAIEPKLEYLVEPEQGPPFHPGTGTRRVEFTAFISRTRGPSRSRHRARLFLSAPQLWCNDNFKQGGTKADQDRAYSKESSR